MGEQAVRQTQGTDRMGGRLLFLVTAVTFLALLLCVMPVGVTHLIRHLPWYLFGVASDRPWALEVWHGGLDPGGALRTTRLEPEEIGISCREVNQLLEGRYSSLTPTQQRGLLNTAFEGRLKGRGVVIVELQDGSGPSVFIRILTWLLLGEVLAFLWRWASRLMTRSA
jgi:hypothetical protein